MATMVYLDDNTCLNIDQIAAITPKPGNLASPYISVIHLIDGKEIGSKLKLEDITAAVKKVAGIKNNY